MPVSTLIALGGGALSALLYGSTLVGTFGALMLMLMAPLPLFLVGLSQGAKATSVAGSVGTLLVLVLTGFSSTVNYVVVDAVPVVLLIRQGTLSRVGADGKIEWYPAGRLTVWLSLYACLVLLGLVVAFAGTEGGLEGELRALFTEMREAWRLEAPPPGAERILDALIAIMPALCASSWLLITAGTGALAQGLLARAGRQLRPSPDLKSFDLPAWLGAAVALLALAGALLPGTLGFIGVNLAFILVMPYFFGGLALLHAFARRSGARIGLFALLYTLLGLLIVILSWLAILGIAALGFIDQVAGLRERLARLTDGPHDSWE